MNALLVLVLSVCSVWAQQEHLGPCEDPTQDAVELIDTSTSHYPAFITQYMVMADSRGTLIMSPLCTQCQAADNENADPCVQGLAAWKLAWKKAGYPGTRVYSPERAGRAELLQYRAHCNTEGQSAIHPKLTGRINLKALARPEDAEDKVQWSASPYKLAENGYEWGYVKQSGDDTSAMLTAVANVRAELAKATPDPAAAGRIAVSELWPEAKKLVEARLGCSVDLLHEFDRWNQDATKLGRNVDTSSRSHASLARSGYAPSLIETQLTAKDDDEENDWSTAVAGEDEDEEDSLADNPDPSDVTDQSYEADGGDGGEFVEVDSTTYLGNCPGQERPSFLPALHVDFVQAPFLAGIQRDATGVNVYANVGLTKKWRAMYNVWIWLSEAQCGPPLGFHNARNTGAGDGSEFPALQAASDVGALAFSKMNAGDFVIFRTSNVAHGALLVDDRETFLKFWGCTKAKRCRHSVEFRFMASSDIDVDNPQGKPCHGDGRA